MSSTDTSVEPAHRPGELMRLVADRLRARGLEVRLPAEEDSRRLSVERAAGRCVLLVDDSGYVEGECQPAAIGPADAKQLADVVTILLTGQGAGYPRLGRGYGRPGITFKGVVGLELKARGFDVDLEIYEDDEVYDVFGGIVATNPANATTMNVRIGDDGAIQWDYDFETAGSITPAAQYPELADSIVSMVARAISMYPAVPGESP